MFFFKSVVLVPSLFERILPTDVIECTFDYLELKDLNNLSLSSRFMNRVISQVFERKAYKLAEEFNFNFDEDDHEFKRELVQMVKLKRVFQDKASALLKLTSHDDVYNPVGAPFLASNSIYSIFSFVPDPCYVNLVCILSSFDKFHLPLITQQISKKIIKSRASKFLIEKSLKEPGIYLNLFKYLCKEVYKCNRMRLISKLKTDYRFKEEEIRALRNQFESANLWLIVKPSRVLSTIISVFTIVLIRYGMHVFKFDLDSVTNFTVFSCLFVIGAILKVYTWHLDFENFEA